MRIELKQAHINNGLRRSCRQCAVALAMEGTLGHPIKVTSQHIHKARGSWDAVTSDERLAKVGKSLRFFIYDFDYAPHKCQPVTLEMKDGVVDIVGIEGEYVPIHRYEVYHIPESFHIKGKCGCIECEFGKDAFTPEQRAMMSVIEK